jgi:hypothetical protein
MKPSVKIGLGIFTSLATAGFIFVYDSYIKDRIDSTEVVVVKAGEEILKSEQITEDKLTIERRPKEALISDVVLAKDMNRIIGEDAQQDIIGNSMISSKMIDSDHLVPDAKKGESIRPITKNMIFAQPGSLRRKDVIDIYLVKPDGTTNLQQNGPSKVNSSEVTKTEDTNNKTTNTRPFLKGVKVVYVKDSGNKEVVSSADGNTLDKRLNATSTISDLEVILNEDDFTKLMDEVLGNGSKILINYQ